MAKRLPQQMVKFVQFLPYEVILWLRCNEAEKNVKLEDSSHQWLKFDISGCKLTYGLVSFGWVYYGFAQNSPVLLLNYFKVVSLIQVYSCSNSTVHPIYNAFQNYSQPSELQRFVTNTLFNMEINDICFSIFGVSFRKKNVKMCIYPPNIHNWEHRE